MKRKLIAVALITVLICVVLGNVIACAPTPTTEYDLIVNSTDDGSVTTPGEGTYTYDEGKVVNLVATPDAYYHFINWTGDVGTIADVEDATTTITMSGDYTITANFGLDIILIANVPDTNQSNQPPTSPTVTLITTIPINYCAPMAMVNILEYWDVVMGHANAADVNAALIPETAAEYLGYFMGTNGMGRPARANPGCGGTLDFDIVPGTLEFVRWDDANPFDIPFPGPPFPLPAGKKGYDWTVTSVYTTVEDLSLDFYTAEIDAGRPLVVSFSYWNPIDLDIAVTDPETEETIDVFKWGGEVGGSEDPNPYEYWYKEWGMDIGHAVTGVGYILNWDPDGAGPLPSDDYVIVHDNWPTTPRNVAIPWANWNSLHAADPGP